MRLLGGVRKPSPPAGIRKGIVGFVKRATDCLWREEQAREKIFVRENVASEPSGHGFADFVRGSPKGWRSFISSGDEVTHPQRNHARHASQLGKGRGGTKGRIAAKKLIAAEAGESH